MTIKSCKSPDLTMKNCLKGYSLQLLQNIFSFEDERCNDEICIPLPFSYKSNQEALAYIVNLLFMTLLQCTCYSFRICITTVARCVKRSDRLKGMVTTEMVTRILRISYVKLLQKVQLKIITERKSFDKRHLVFK